MTEEQRKVFREYNRERLSDPEKRKAYNEYMKQYQREAKARETPEQKEERLKRNRANAKRRYWEKKYGKTFND